ncbi:MAG: hypothetical protein V4590_13555 [Bacteroidota bacterium]
MKTLWHLFLLFIALLNYGCSKPSQDDDSPKSPTLVKYTRQPRWVEIKGKIIEEYTKQPIANMRMRLDKEVPSEYIFGWPSYDSISEVVTNSEGEYRLKFWCNNNESNYQLHCLSDSTLLPNSDYFPEGDLMPPPWSLPEGVLFQGQPIYPFQALNEDSLNVNMLVKSYSYVTIKLKRIKGFEEPMDYNIMINKDTVRYLIKFPIHSSVGFAKTFVFNRIDPVEMRIHLYRTFQNNVLLSKMVTPVPMKVTVVEYEF